MSTNMALVRSQVAARLLASGFLLRESQEPVLLIREPTHSPVHLEFAVGAERETYAARNAQERTIITVVVPYHLPPKDRITGYTSVLTLERNVVDTLAASDWGALSPRLAALCQFEGVREAGLDGWIWLTITCTALHATSLA